jgi:hypothetical protein
MPAIDTVGFRLGASQTFPTAVTVNTGDSLSIRNHAFEAGAWLEGVWARVPSANRLRVRSPRLHDFVQGYRFQLSSTEVYDFLGEHAVQRVYPQDPLTVEGGTGAGEVLAGALSIYYADLPGASARLANWDEIAGRIEHLLAQEVDVTGSATAGEWGPGASVVSSFDVLKVNRDYAVLGAETSVTVATVAIRGTDTGNLRVGHPAKVGSLESREFWVRRSIGHRTPHIPVFNSANRGSTLVDVQDNSASPAVNVSFLLALLAG